LGLLSFLKKKKKLPIDEDLDMPPAPPPIGGSEKHLFKSRDDIPLFPGLKGKRQMPSALPPAEPKERFPGFPDFSKKAPKPPEPFPTRPLKAPRLFKKEDLPKPTFVKHEVPIPKEFPEIQKEFLATPPGSHIFVEVGDFKDSLKSINSVKKDVKKLESYFKNIHEFRTRNDEEFGKYKHLLEDVERRLKLLDNKLFG